MKLLPESWLTGHSQPLFPDVNASDTRTTEDEEAHFRAGVWLGTVRDNLVGIGLVGRYAALKAVIDRYSRFADKIYFPYPHDLATSKTPDPEQRTLLLMLFERSRLAAAAKVRHSTS